MKIYIDGVFYPESEAKVSVFDHGLLYGDGIFEGIRLQRARLPAHRTFGAVVGFGQGDRSKNAFELF